MKKILLLAALVVGATAVRYLRTVHLVETIAAHVPKVDAEFDPIVHPDDIESRSATSWIRDGNYFINDPAARPMFFGAPPFAGGGYSPAELRALSDDLEGLTQRDAPLNTRACMACTFAGEHRDCPVCEGSGWVTVE